LTLRYCNSCKKICDSQSTIAHESLFLCKTCKKQCTYFGKEAVSLSPEDILAKYDALNPFNPLHHFSGLTKDYQNDYPDIGVIECEEILKHHPSNPPALRYLSHYYWKLGINDKALDYMEKINQAQAISSEDIAHYLTLLLIKKQYAKISTIITSYTELLSPFIAANYQAIAHLGLNNVKKALEIFYQAYHLCENTDRQNKIKTIIRYLNTALEPSD